MVQPPTPRTAPPQHQAPLPHRAPAPEQKLPFDRGDLAAQVPTAMRVDEPTLVEVRVARQALEQINRVAQAGRGGRRDFVVSQAMTLRVRAASGAFTIENAAPETQWIENRLGLLNDDFVVWRWSVTPRQRGQQTVQIIGNLRSVTADGIATETALPDEATEVSVRPAPQKTAGRIATWMVAMALGAVVALSAPIVIPMVRNVAGL
ncbi:MAG: hypothetical protein AAFR23_04355 [Pseudomonadota bacterium]